MSNEDIDSALSILHVLRVQELLGAEAHSAFRKLFDELKERREKQPKPKKSKVNWCAAKAFRVEGSSNIKAARYVSREEALMVAFKNGGIYRYSEVPKEVWKEFREAESKGRFLNQHVKGHFACEKIG